MDPKVIYYPGESTAFLVDKDSGVKLPLRPNAHLPTYKVKPPGWREGEPLVELLDGTPRFHYTSAIRIDSLRAGQFMLNPPSFIGGAGALESLSEPIVQLWLSGVAPSGILSVYPHPCVHVPIGAFIENPPIWRGIPKSAAGALLDLTSSLLNIETKMASTSWGFGKKPAIENVSHAWRPAAFITAWMWGKWNETGRQGAQVSIASRHEQMAAVGYEGKLGAFKTMISRLGLRVTDWA